jgi:hypothetical protein
MEQIEIAGLRIAYARAAMAQRLSCCMGASATAGSGASRSPHCPTSTWW